MLDGFPPYAINVYLMGDVLVDAGSRHATRRILRQLNGRTVAAHALTHAHPDHQGASHEVCETLSLPLWCGELDAEAMEDGRDQAPPAEAPDQRDRRPGVHRPAAPGRAGGFTRATRSRASRCSTSRATRPATSRSGGRPTARSSAATCSRTSTRSPASPACTSRSRSSRRTRCATGESMRRLAALEPELVCFGHGRPLREPGQAVGVRGQAARD